MEIIENENELVIKVSKDSYMYNALTKKGEVKEYLKYLLGVDRAINGSSDGVLLCYEFAEVYIDTIKNYNKDELKNEFKKCLEAMKQEIDYMKNHIGYDYVEAFANREGFDSIDENASFHIMNVFFERLVGVSELLDKGEM